MFTYALLGKVGRFGNHLFQIAGTIGMAARHGVDYQFPIWEHSSLFKTPIPQTVDLPRPDYIFTHRSYHFVDLSMTFNEPCVVDLRGFFQSEKFFLHCAEKIRAYFEPSSAISAALNMGYGHILRRGPSCIVVVRRGDYVTLADQHPPQTAEFYAAAMEMFEPGTAFFVTSDDIAWCHENIKRRDVIFLPESSWAHNFFLGTLCEHAITSNTSFGWWIAYLCKNKRKRVIAAKRWLGPAKADHNTKDLLPPGWISL